MSSYRDKKLATSSRLQKEELDKNLWLILKRL